MGVLRPTTIDEVRGAVRDHARVRVRGAGTKTALRGGPHEDGAVIDVGALSGLVEYDPGEFTFTALGATPLAVVQRELARHGQTLPFDPPLVDRGATLAGTLAAGLSGPGRYRFGGVRDFVLGVRFVDGRGRLVAGGGKVVKNAAGFDLPKLMAGSLGRLGIVVEATFKVFPRPEAHATVRRAARDIAEAIALIVRLSRSPFDLHALDIVVDPGGSIQVDARLAGLPDALPARLDALRAELDGDIVLAGDDDRAWQEAREFAWVPESATLVKVPLTPSRVARAEAVWASGCPARRYGAGGQVAWLAWQNGMADLDAILRELGLTGLVVLSPAPIAAPLLGHVEEDPFADRVKRAIDPDNRFGPG
jgi:glycolate oxidase FAD binding subunit